VSEEVFVNYEGETIPVIVDAGAMSLFTSDDASAVIAAADEALSAAASATAAAGQAQDAANEAIAASVNKLDRDGDNSEPAFLNNVGAAAIDGDNINVTAANGSATPGGEDIGHLRFGTDAGSVALTDLSAARASAFHAYQPLSKAAPDEVWPEDGVNQFGFFFESTVLPTPTFSGSNSGTFTLSSGTFATVATVSLSGVTPNSLFLIGTAPALGGGAVMTGGTVSVCTYRIIEVVGGIDGDTVFTGTFVVSEISTGPQVLSVTNSSASAIAAFNLARSTTGNVSYRLEARRTAGTGSVTNVQINLVIGRHTTNYQKGPMLVRMDHYDPSPAGVIHDGVAAQFFAVTRSGVKLRSWSQHVYNIVLPGTDGYIVGIENYIENYGSACLVMDVEETKIVKTFGAAINTVTTGAAFYAVAGGNFQNFIWGRDQFLTSDGYLIRSEPGFAIRRFGTSFAIGIGTDTPLQKGGLFLHAKDPGAGAISQLFEIPPTVGTGQLYTTWLVTGQVARSFGYNRVTNQVIISEGEDLSVSSPAMACFTPDNIDFFSNGGLTTGGTNIFTMFNGTAPSAFNNNAANLYAIGGTWRTFGPMGSAALLRSNGVASVGTITPDRTMIIYDNAGTPFTVAVKA